MRAASALTEAATELSATRRRRGRVTATAKPARASPAVTQAARTNPSLKALADRIGTRPLMVTGLFLQAAGLGWIAAVARPGLAYALLIAPMVIVGCGFSLALPAMTKAVVGSVAPADIGRASGTFTTMRQLGGAFGVAIGVAVFAAAGSYASPSAFSDGFVPATWVTAGLALAGFAAALTLPRRRRAPDTPVVTAVSGEAARIGNR